MNTTTLIPETLMFIQPYVAIRIIATIIGGILLIIIFRFLITLSFRGLRRKSERLQYQKRLDTVRTLLENTISIGLFAIVLLMIIKDLGFDITPLLTGAGILGLAVSFGSQTLVKDIISGLFIILENQYNVGDRVEIAGSKGVVEKINVRTTVLKDDEGNRSIIPNAKIEKVTILREKVRG